jgi:DNA-binding transcriptional LysR family regulator
MAHMPLAQWLEQLSGGQTPWMRTANLTAQLKAVQANLGIAALPAYVGQGEGLRPVLDDLPPQGADIWLLRNLATQGLERVDRVVEHLVAQFQRSLAPRP